VRDGIVGRLTFGKLTKLALPGINAPRARLDLAPLTNMESFLTRPPRVIYFTSEELEYPRDRWPESFRFVGPAMWGPEPEEPEWISEVDRPIVLVTCSTEQQEDAEILRAGLDGLPQEGYFVVGTSAAYAPEDLATSPPPHTRVERFIPHDSILPRATAVVCHGGMGITQRALAHGVPVVVVPFGRDQLEVANRVEYAGAGVRLSPKKLDPSSLTSAVRRAVSLEEGARRMSAVFTNSGGAAAAADAYEEVLQGNHASPARKPS
jgi:MGT family glycosyltransferase